jgi:hypothetical protein
MLLALAAAILLGAGFVALVASAGRASAAAPAISGVAAPRVAAKATTPAASSAPSATKAVRVSKAAGVSKAADASKAATISTVVHTAKACAVAMAYLAAHAAPGFAHYCRPGALQTADGPSAAYTCVPGVGFTCPDGRAEIIIADPTCAASYENEASNSYWDFSTAGVIAPGAVQNGRTWDPYGECPA